MSDSGNYAGSAGANDSVVGFSMRAGSIVLGTNVLN